jgi:hypothetical protein
VPQNYQNYYYWKADPHRWGPGRAHLIGPSGRKTLCGRPLSTTPGRLVPASTNECDCRACLQTAERNPPAEEEEAEAETSPAQSRLPLDDAPLLCEACRERPAAHRYSAVYLCGPCYSAVANEGGVKRP